MFLYLRLFEIMAWNESIVNSSVSKFLLSISLGSLTGSVIHANVLLNDLSSKLQHSGNDILLADDEIGS